MSGLNADGEFDNFLHENIQNHTQHRRLLGCRVTTNAIDVEKINLSVPPELEISERHVSLQFVHPRSVDRSSFTYTNTDATTDTWVSSNAILISGWVWINETEAAVDIWVAD